MINLLPRTRTALLVDGDALLVVRARLGISGVSSKTLARVEGFLDAPIDACRAALRAVAGDRSGETVLVVPGSWCPSRPVPITSKSWTGAREARRELIEAYFPFAASDCYAGLLDLAGEEDAGRGAMFVAPTELTGPWREKIAQAIGRPVDETIASTMALPALGLQSLECACVVERGEPDLASVLEWGRPVSVAMPYDETDLPEGALCVVGEGDPSIRDARRLSAEDLALAACVLPFVPGVRYRALGSDRGAKLDRRVPLVAALAVVAVGAIFASLSLSDARYQRGIDALDARLADQRGPIDETVALRKDTERLAETIETINATTEEWGSILPDLERAFGTVGSPGFVHRVELTPTRLVLSGEAPVSLEVLDAIESTGAFRGARQSGSVMQTERDLETFNLEARRVQKGAEE